MAYLDTSNGEKLNTIKKKKNQHQSQNQEENPSNYLKVNLLKSSLSLIQRLFFLMAERSSLEVFFHSLIKRGSFLIANGISSFSPGNLSTPNRSR